MILSRIVVVAMLLTTSRNAPPAAAQPSCSLAPVLALFRQVAGTDVVGDCKEPAVIAENGDVTQHTTRGLAVYRYADQTVAFTDGSATWLFGPDGLQKRAVADRFGWELASEPTRAAPAVESTPEATATSTPTLIPTAVRTPTRTPTPTPTPRRSRLTPALAAKCSSLGFDIAFDAAPAIGGQATELARIVTSVCRDTVEQYGEAGYECVDSGFREGWRTGSRLPPGSAAIAAEATMALIELCTRSLP